MAINTLTNMVTQQGSDFVSDFMSCFDEKNCLISREKTEHCFWLIDQFLRINMIDNYYQQKISKINETMVKLRTEIEKKTKGSFDNQMVEVYFKIKELYIKRISAVTPQTNVAPKDETYPMGMGKTTYNNNYAMYSED